MTEKALREFTCDLCDGRGIVARLARVDNAPPGQIAPYEETMVLFGPERQPSPCTILRTSCFLGTGPRIVFELCPCVLRRLSTLEGVEELGKEGKPRLFSCCFCSADGEMMVAPGAVELEAGPVWTECDVPAPFAPAFFMIPADLADVTIMQLYMGGEPVLVAPVKASRFMQETAARRVAFPELSAGQRIRVEVLAGLDSAVSETTDKQDKGV